MRVLVTGATGLLGAHIAAALQSSAEVIGVDRHEWWGDQPLRVEHVDLSDRDGAARVVRAAEPEIVFHCAALVNVDACERSPEQAFALNAEMPGRLAAEANKDCLFVYVTTDGVFRGDVPLVDETMPTAPRTVYGASKLRGEEAVAAATPNHLILRTNFFGWSSGRKPTFAEWLYGALATQQPITLFDDFYFTPIYVVDFVGAMLALVQTGARGVFHLAGADRVSKYEFGMEMARQAAFSTDRVRRGSLDDAHLAATRPKDMSLNVTRAASLIGSPLPGYRAGISRFLQDREKTLSQRSAAASSLRSRA